RRANAQARAALGAAAEPSPAWNAGDRDAWSDVLKVADATPPFSFMELDPLMASARQTVQAVARRLRPGGENAWAEFTLPELLLLTERVSRDLRGTALRYVPGVRDVKLSHVLWVKSQYERYGGLAAKLYSLGTTAWRLFRVPVNPVGA